MRWLRAITLLGVAIAALLPRPGLLAVSLRDPSPFDDFTLREEMVAMRDGVKLFTLILTPKNAKSPLPILLQRTPYDASKKLGSRATSRLAATQGQEFFANGDYVVVFQDIRGRFKSDGDYVMYRPPVGPFNPTKVDESTDAWDTIDWLVKNVPANNGKVGLWGTSYPGWLTLAGLRDPHPALAAAVPFNPVVDAWKADDWFHWGAFRAVYSFDFIHAMESRKGQPVGHPYESYDLYRWALSLGNLSRGLTERLDGRHHMWARLIEFPAYGPFWKSVAADQWFPSAPKRMVPTLHVHGLFDQEDIYGSPAVYSALETYDKANDLNFFAAGPWYHGQHWADGTHLGSIVFDEDTAKRFREDLLTPFLRKYLHGDGVPAPAPATVFETGSNRWRRFERWPPPTEVRRLYLQPGGGLAFTAPQGGAPSTAYVSDPARPVPYAPRPLWGFSYENPAAVAAWRRWLVEDQRFVDGRPDVATWMGAPLTEPVTIRGPVVARLFAETTGTDADWVVKLIDVFPDEDPERLEMSGYEWMVSADIFRGRYRESLEAPRALAPSTVLSYTLPLPHANHSFKRGHRIMVQVQSTWFPLYDLNPQKFVPRINDAVPADYQAATERVHHSAKNPSHVELLVDAATR